jgi:Domain of unknown function (DUF5134)
VPGPAWIPYSLAAVMVAVSLYCVGRLIFARLWGRLNHTDVNVSHILMGAAMAGALVPSHNPVSRGVGEVVFGVLGAWFLARSGLFLARRAGSDRTGPPQDHHLSHYPIHMVMAGAMVYMYAVGTPRVGGQGPAMLMSVTTAGPQGYVALSLLFVVGLFGSAVWQLDGITQFAPAGIRVVSAGQGGTRTGGTGFSHRGSRSPAMWRCA